MNPVLIDTCAWIDFLRSQHSELGNQVADLISQQRARLCGVVIAELLQGLKSKEQGGSEKERSLVNLLIARIPCLETDAADWIAAGNTAAKLRSEGITVPLTDALIASIAQRYGITVLTIDKHFVHLNAAH